MIDTHAHINTKQFDNDIKQVIERANNAGVDKVIVVGMDAYHNQKALELIDTYPNLYASIGIHPTTLKGNVSDLKPLLEHKKVVAIGETGIDLHWQTDNLDLQKKYFIEQIELAIAYQLPIIVHTRNSFKEAYECLLPYKGHITGVFHSFSSNLEDAKKAIDLGFYIGISGVVTFKKASELHDIVKHIDLKHMILETDAPYLAPVPHRGSRNEPSYTQYVLKEVAKIKAISPQFVDEITTKNANNLFGLEKSSWKKCLKYL